MSFSQVEGAGTINFTQESKLSPLNKQITNPLCWWRSVVQIYFHSFRIPPEDIPVRIRQRVIRIQVT